MSYSNIVPEIRAKEIKYWLKYNTSNKWAVVDDMEMSPYIENFVKCEPTIGLNEDVAQKIIEILCK